MSENLGFDLGAWGKDHLRKQPIDNLVNIFFSAINLYHSVDWKPLLKAPKFWVEHKFIVEFGGGWRLQGTMDFAAEFLKYVHVIDWKTYRGKKERHVERKKLAMQPNVYATFWREKDVQFNFHSAQVTNHDVVVTPRRPTPILRDLMSVATQISTMQNERRGWNFPTNTENCMKYGRKCEFFDVCARAPRSLPEERHDWPVVIRQSSLDTWFTCPEKYRMTRVHEALDMESEGSEETEYGSAVHDALATMIVARLSSETNADIITSIDQKEAQRYLVRRQHG